MDYLFEGQPLVSIIIPVYNVEKYLDQCIKSVQQQTYTNMEAILVDDGSLDSSGEMCNQFQKNDSRICVIHQKNGGLSSARNSGIAASHGDYLMFVDGDDWLELDAVEVLLKLCMDYKADIAECQYQEVISKTRIEKQNNTKEIKILNKIEALEGMLDWTYFKPMVWGKIYRREVIKDIRFPEKKLHEDEFTTYKYIYNAKRLIHIDSIKYNYNRMRNNSITAQFSLNNLDACEAFLERRDFFRNHGIEQLEEKMNNAYCIVVLDNLYQCYKNRLHGERVEQLISQVKKDIAYLEERPVDIYFVNELKIAAESLEKYGLHRKESEGAPKANLIDPVYKVEKYLKRCIASITQLFYQ